MKYTPGLMIMLSCLLTAGISLQAQTDSVKVYPDFRFSDGIYLTYDEFRKNTPTYTQFDVKYRQGSAILTIPCPDSLGSGSLCEVKDAWGYCENKSVYIHQGYRQMYYRVQVIGALTHYFVIEMEYTDPGMTDPFSPFSTMPSRRISNREMVMEWETGESFEFCYRNLREFLKEKDVELYQRLETSKRKRKMIYFFMLQYNERHPVFIYSN